MAKKGKKVKGGATFEVDFSDVTEGGGKGGNPRIKAGTYHAEISEVELGNSQAGNSKAVVSWTIDEGKFDGTKLKEHIVFTKEAAWRSFNLLAAIGKNPQKKLSKVQPLAWKGESAYIDVEDDEYENKSGKTIPTSKVAGYVSEDDFEPDKKSKKDKGKKSKNGKGKDKELDEVDLEDEL